MAYFLPFYSDHIAWLLLGCAPSIAKRRTCKSDAWDSVSTGLELKASLVMLKDHSSRGSESLSLYIESCPDLGSSPTAVGG